MMITELQSILEAELSAGNEISEDTCWPPICERLVILRYPFKAKHAPSENVEYVEINDSHYWKAEYRYRGGRQTLACKF